MELTVFTFETGMMIKLFPVLPPGWEEGEGPFKVVKVREVEDKCNCEADYFNQRLDDGDEPYPHRESCGVFSTKNVGHHQLATIQTLKGESLLSGAWLIPA